MEPLGPRANIAVVQNEPHFCDTIDNLLLSIWECIRPWLEWMGCLTAQVQVQPHTREKMVAVFAFARALVLLFRIHSTVPTIEVVRNAINDDGFIGAARKDFPILLSAVGITQPRTLDETLQQFDKEDFVQRVFAKTTELLPTMTAIVDIKLSRSVVADVIASTLFESFRTFWLDTVNRNLMRVQEYVQLLLLDDSPLQARFQTRAQQLLLTTPPVDEVFRFAKEDVRRLAELVHSRIVALSNNANMPRVAADLPHSTMIPLTNETVFDQIDRVVRSADAERGVKTVITEELMKCRNWTDDSLVANLMLQVLTFIDLIECVRKDKEPNLDDFRLFLQRTQSTEAYKNDFGAMFFLMFPDGVIQTRDAEHRIDRRCIDRAWVQFGRVHTDWTTLQQTTVWFKQITKRNTDLYDPVKTGESVKA